MSTAGQTVIVRRKSKRMQMEAKMPTLAMMLTVPTQGPNVYV